MKTSLAAAALVVLSICPAFGRDFTTTKGVIYKDAEVTSRAPDGINVSYADGIAKILFTDLPATVQKEFGYDPAKVAAYQEAVAMAQNARLKALAAPSAPVDAPQELTPDPATDALLSKQAAAMAKKGMENWRKSALTQNILDNEFHGHSISRPMPNAKQMEADYKAKLVEDWRKEQLKQQGKL